VIVSSRLFLCARVTVRMSDRLLEFIHGSDSHLLKG
jgi:hypothetical protein